MSSNHHRTTGPTSPTPIPVAEILDTYPERVTSLGGVRQHNRHTAIQARGLAPVWRRRPRPRFGASLLVTLAAQGALAAAISAQRIAPLFGAAVAVALMLCGLLLIVAELLTVANR